MRGTWSPVSLFNQHWTCSALILPPVSSCALGVLHPATWHVDVGPSRLTDSIPQQRLLECQAHSARPGIPLSPVPSREGTVPQPELWCTAPQAPQGRAATAGGARDSQPSRSQAQADSAGVGRPFQSSGVCCAKTQSDRQDTFPSDRFKMGKTQNVCAHTIQLNERQEKNTPKSMQR